MEPLAVYCRVSGDQQAKEETIQTQRQETSRYCALHDLPIYDYYLDGEGDKGVTGMLLFEERPEGRRLLADAAAGKFKEILVYKTARLGRDFYDTGYTLKVLRDRGLLVRSVTESYDATTPDGRFMQGIHAVVAGKARDDIVEASRHGCDRVAPLGTWMGGPRPFGYHTEGRDTARRLVVYEEEAQWVRRIFQWLVVDRMACNAIARRLNSLGVLTPYAAEGKTFRGVPSSGLWVATRVRSLVANPVYKGLHPYGKKSKIRETIWRRVAAIVDEEIWEAAQQQLDENMKYGARNRKRSYLLSGKIRCGACGGCYVGIKQHRCEKLEYICKTRNHFGRKGCTSPNVGAADAEAVIWGQLEAWLRNPGQAIAELGEQTDQRAGELETLREQIATLVQRQEAKKRERQRLIDLYTSEAISREDYQIKYGRLNQDETELRAEEEALRDAAEMLQRSQQELRGAERFLCELNARMDDPPTWEQKRELVKLLLLKAVVTEEADGPTLDATFLFSRPSAPLGNKTQFRSVSNRGCVAVRRRLALALH